jgi:predicted restriction endonuclease
MSNGTATIEATIERIAAEFQTRKPANYQFDAFQKYKKATALREGKVAPAAPAAFDPATVKDTRKQTFTTQRDGQAEFRKQLIAAYGGKCAVTSNRVEAILEAAHITPYKGEDSNHVSNGLLLSAELHILFDRGLIAIDLSGCLLVSSKLTGSIYESYKGKRVAMPVDPANRPSRKALDRHRETFIP